MSHYVSGVILRKECSCQQVSLVGNGRTRRFVPKEGKHRLETMRRTAIVHELTKLVSGSVRGVTDYDTDNGLNTIFQKRGTKAQLLSGATCACEYFKVVETGEVSQVSEIESIQFSHEREPCRSIIRSVHDAYGHGGRARGSRNCRGGRRTCYQEGGEGRGEVPSCGMPGGHGRWRQLPLWNHRPNPESCTCIITTPDLHSGD